jgi:hypothetical protein
MRNRLDKIYVKKLIARNIGKFSIIPKVKTIGFGSEFDVSVEEHIHSN